MIKCSRRQRSRIIPLAMAAALLLNSAGSPIMVLAQENDSQLSGGYEAALDASLEEPESAGSEDSELTDSVEVSAENPTENPTGEGQESGNDEGASGEDNASGNEETAGENKDDSEAQLPEGGGDGIETETDETQQPSEEQPVEDVEGNTGEGVQDEITQDETLQDETSSEIGNEDGLIADGITNKISWKIDKNGKLSLLGSGDYELDSEEHTPWYAYREEIKSAEVVIAGLTSAKNMFNGCKNLKSLDVSNLNTSQVTDMSGMFRYCEGLNTLNLSGFNTSNVTNMSRMFSGCADLYYLNLSSFDTSNVTTMSGMFSGCNLNNLNLSNFDTSNVTNMSNMFSACADISNLKLNSFDTSNVTNMSYMFFNSTGLLTLDISSFKTSNVTDMSSMFYNCLNLRSLDLRSFDTGNVKSMSAMFSGCKNLRSLDLRSFDTSNVTNMLMMFHGCNGLSNLDISSFNTSNVTNMSSMFYDCLNFRSLDLRSFDTGNVKNMSGMFFNCTGLSSLDISSFKTSNVTDMSHMFCNCAGLSNLDLSSFDTSNVKNMSWMFDDCYALITLDLSSFNTGNVTNMSWMFSSCAGLSDLDLSSFNTGNVTDMSWMFSSCTGLNNLGLRSFDTSNVTDMSWMFYNCENLRSLDLSSFDMSNVTNMSAIVGKDSKLVYIRTPKNCSQTVELPISSSIEGWYDELHKVYKTLPVNLPESIDLYKNGYPGDGTTKKMACISGVSIADKTYDGEPDTYAGNAVVKDVEGNVLSGMDIRYSYQGKLKDDSEYTETTQAPTQAGSYTLLVTAQDDTYAGEASYNFKINQKAIKISAESVSIDMGEQLPEPSELKYDIDGLVKDDELVKEPNLKYSAENIDTSKSGKYEIIPSDADAGNNYSIKYVKGTLDIVDRSLIISGITAEDKGYDREAYEYDGTAVVKDADGNTLPDAAVNYEYQGTLANGSEYLKTVQAPTQAGQYTLIVSAQNGKYTGQMLYEFYIFPKVVRISAESESIDTGDELPKLSELTYRADGLIEGDELVREPQFRYSLETIDTDVSETYDIIPYDADAGNNYIIVYINGTLTIGGSADDPSYGDDSSYPDDERTDIASVGGAIAKIKAKTYDGSAYEPVVKVTVTINDKKKTLIEGTDYRVTYEDNVNAGIGRVYVRGNGIYKGEITGKFTINPKPVKKLKVITGSITAEDIDNTSIEFPVCVYDGSRKLTRGEDYDLSVKDQTAKALTLNITGIEGSNYTGATSAKLTIYESTDAGKLINPKNVIIEGKDYNEKYKETYTGKPIKPTVTVEVGETTLDSKYYKVAYQNNKDAGTAYVIVTGKGEYKGKAVVPFSIEPKQSVLQIADIKDKTYNGKLQMPAVTVKAENVKLKKGRDYTVKYKDNLHAGTATVIVTGKGNYSGKEKTQFTINKQEIKKVSIKGNQKGGIDVYYGNSLLRKDTDYTLEFGNEKGKDNIEVTIIAAGKSDFTDSVTKSVKIYVALKEAGREIDMEVGETYQLGLEKSGFQNIDTRGIYWESSNPEVVSVDKEKGLITTNKVGAAAISMYANNRKTIQQCYVVVKGEDVMPQGRYLTFRKANGSVDDTEAIRNCVDSAYNWGYDGVYIPAGVYRINAVKSIFMKDNLDLIMSPSAMLVAIGNSSTNYNVIWIYKLKNVTVSGGTIIGERYEHGSKKGEWGHGIGVYDCDNVHISNMDISQCWGDGIYLGASKDSDVHATNTNVTITDCNVHDNRRNNLSITAADDVTIDRCKFNYAKGTDPQFGIDIETNNRKNPCERITISNTEMIGNAKASMGIMTVAKDIRLENCTLSGKFYNWAGKKVVLHNTKPKGGVVDKTGGVKYE